MASKIKKGDEVIIIAGRDKGKKGKILKVFPKESRVIVQGVHIVKRHKKPTMETPGSIEEKESTIHVSNVAMMAKDGKPTRVGFTMVDGKKIRIEKRTGEVIKG